MGVKRRGHGKRQMGRWRGWRSGGNKAGEMDGLGGTNGRGQDGWMAAEVCLLAAPSPPSPRERNGGWHIRGLLGKLMEMI